MELHHQTPQPAELVAVIVRSLLSLGCPKRNRYRPTTCSIVAAGSSRFRVGFLSHLRSPEGYDEPEILPSSSRQICLTRADAGHMCHERTQVAGQVAEGRLLTTVLHG